MDPYIYIECSRGNMDIAIYIPDIFLCMVVFVGLGPHKGKRELFTWIWRNLILHWTQPSHSKKTILYFSVYSSITLCSNIHTVKIKSPRL